MPTGPRVSRRKFKNLCQGHLGGILEDLKCLKPPIGSTGASSLSTYPLKAFSHCYDSINFLQKRPLLNALGRSRI